MTVACITSYIVIIIMIITRCLPVQRNWQIKPYAGGKYFPSTAGVRANKNIE